MHHAPQFGEPLQCKTVVCFLYLLIGIDTRFPSYQPVNKRGSPRRNFVKGSTLDDGLRFPLNPATSFTVHARVSQRTSYLLVEAREAVAFGPHSRCADAGAEPAVFLFRRLRLDFFFACPSPPEPVGPF